MIDADADALGTSVPNRPALPDSADALTRLRKHCKLIVHSNVDRESFAGSDLPLQSLFQDQVPAKPQGFRRSGSTAVTNSPARVRHPTPE
ncbi:hypothetical protein ACFC1I_15490 [Microbacterium sp. NPDC056044]|uniref:hypothetical protein n=1 Tax=Microbacterium sp. NPDC056044 TaxID=3345690 RepID=UPI0035D5FCCD